MRFTTVIPAFVALAAAAPQPNPDMYENIDISDFTVRKDQGPDGAKINAVYFKLSGEDATDLTCEKSNPGLPSDVITCGESKYRFSLKEGTGEYEFGLDLYHELDLRKDCPMIPSNMTDEFSVGFYGDGNVPTYCRAGGNGPQDFVCTQVSATTIVIDSLPDPQ